MKKSILCSLALLFSVSLFAQENTVDPEVNYPSHELKLNALSLVLGGFDISYEYFLNEESALGLNALVVFDDDLDTDLNYYISPYYRLYFGQNYAAGFFIEGFGMLSSVKDNRAIFFDNFGNITGLEEENVTDFALGIGLGGKWVTKSGFIGEIGLGIGRNLFNSDESGYDLVVKGGITVGYRF
ncbi:hypothetical protein SAMN04515667_0750 [Formosa sp. Hel1_31_208]|uniref:hypothetical protein n=1 Tax=Formosa sp. Hel1_31_208 TaxID=1798225 RepID=UPI00087B5B85|nr:hypothetical protein [Formosa sp. Hel1_31_208]SDR81757.1 hypothetical protein SAMN04515667_0750 [Formosa sp. Hel1_31_208]